MVALPFTSSFALLVIGRLFQVTIYNEVILIGTVSKISTIITILHQRMSISEWSPWSNSDNGFGSILHGRRIFDCFPHWTREVETFHHGFPCNHRLVSMLSLCYSTTIYHRRPMSLALTIRSWVFGSNVPCPTISAKLWRNFSGSDLRQVIISSFFTLSVFLVLSLSLSPQNYIDLKAEGTPHREKNVFSCEVFPTAKYLLQSFPASLFNFALFPSGKWKPIWPRTSSMKVFNNKA